MSEKSVEPEQSSNALAKCKCIIIQILGLNGLCDWRSTRTLVANQSTRKFQSNLGLGLQSKVQSAVATASVWLLVLPTLTTRKMCVPSVKI